MFLDSSFCIDLMREERRGEQGPASRKLQELDPAALFLPMMDALIGAMAKLHGQPLLARHEEHFALIPDLVVETYL